MCVQAAQKALTEMEGIPEPSSPLKATHLRSSAPASLQPSREDDHLSSIAYSMAQQSANGSRANETGWASENGQSKGSDANGGASQRPSSGASRRRWAPLQRIDSNADGLPGQAADGVQRRESLQTRRTGSALAEKAEAQQRRVQGTPKARPRRRAAGSMDFGVQVYAPERPHPQSGMQVCSFICRPKHKLKVDHYQACLLRKA